MGIKNGAKQASAGAFMSGAPAKLLLANGFDVRVLRSNDLLQKDEWKLLDDAVVRVARRMLGAIDDLRNAGLTKPLGGLGVLLAEYEKISDLEEAEQSMSGVTPGQRDLPDYSLAGVPVPITFRDFEVNIRMLQASRTRGAAIDTTAAELAARRVAEKLEDTLFNGSGVVVSGSTLYGYTTHPDRITGAVLDWADTVNVSGEEILTDVNDMIAAAEAENYFGPFMMYVPVDFNGRLREDFKANSDKTIRQRILELEQVTGIRATASLTDEVVLVQLTSDVVDLPVGQDITTVEWESMGGLVQSFKVMAAIAPRIKSAANDKTGLVHHSV